MVAKCQCSLQTDMDLELKDEDYRAGNMVNNMGGGNQGNNMQMMGQWGPMMGPMMGDPSGMMMGGPMGPGPGWGPMGMNMGMMGIPGGLVDPSMPRQPIKLSNDTTLYPPSASK